MMIDYNYFVLKFVARIGNFFLWTEKDSIDNFKKFFIYI